MKNVIINTGCNLCCPYCFAEDFMSTNAQDMTEENFDKVVKYFKKYDIRSMRILGGEPTLSNNFHGFMQKLMDDPHFEHIHIFTNGLFGDEVMNTIMAAHKKKKVSVLVNFNHPDQLDPIDKNYPRTKLVKKNMEKLVKEGIIRSAGINIYKPDFDYSYCLDFMKEHEMKNLRFSVTVPNTKVDPNFDIKEHYRSYLPLLQRLAKECDENKIEADSDCNSYPKCVLTGDEFKEFAMLNFGLCNKDTCHPVLDIQPNLEVIRCLGFSESDRIKLDLEKAPHTYTQYYEENLDKLIIKKTLFEECKNCNIYKREGQSCGCLCYQGIK